MKHLRLLVLAGLLIGLMVVAVDCTSAPEALVTEPYFTGFVTEINPIGEQDVIGLILAEAQVDNRVDKYWVTVKDEALISQQDEENRRQVTFEALETEQKVQIWFSGPIMESFPLQGTAQQIVIIK